MMYRLKSAFKNALAFGIAGPAIGVLVYSVWGWTLSGVLDVYAVLGIVWLLPLGYLLGGVPAAVTGFLIGLLIQPARPLAYLGASAVAGALAAGTIALLDSSEPSSMDGVATPARGSSSTCCARRVTRRPQPRAERGNGLRHD